MTFPLPDIGPLSPLMSATTPGAHCGWASFSVAPASAGDAAAAQLLELANDPLAWSLANLGATVIRQRLHDHDVFHFSPQGVVIFEAFIRERDGGPCNPPLARKMVPSKTSRMLLGFKTWWDPFEAPIPGVPPRKSPRP